MQRFWVRLARLNAPFLAAALREAARQVELLEPGPPVLVTPVIFRTKEAQSMSSITVKDTDSPFGATVAFLDAVGQPTAPDDVPQWTSNNEMVARVVASDDGLSATITPGIVGAAVIGVTSTDADGSVLVGNGTVTVQPSEARIMDIEFQAPAPPEPVPPPAEVVDEAAPEGEPAA